MEERRDKSKSEAVRLDVEHNVLIGDGVLDSDRGLFFGPLRDDDHFIRGDASWTLPRLLAELRVFHSSNDAHNRGFRGPVPDGFTDLTSIGKSQQRVTILKIG